MSYEQLIADIQGDYTEHRISLGDIYHELRVALHKYTIGKITPEAYNAKIEEMQKFLESIKYRVGIRYPGVAVEQSEMLSADKTKFSPNQNV